MRLRRFCFVVFFTSFFASNLSAEDYSAAFEACVANDDEDSDAISVCLLSELAYWDRLVARELKEAEKKLSPLQRRKLQKAQEAWEGFRDAQCLFETSRGKDEIEKRFAGASCLLTKTVERAESLQETREGNEISEDD